MNRHAIRWPLWAVLWGSLGCAPKLLTPQGVPEFAAGHGPNGGLRQAVLRAARAELGKPYCHGGAGPGCFDCSGLVVRAWQRGAGFELPRTSAAMKRALDEVPLHAALPGDILYWPGHVGLFVDAGRVLDAGSTPARVTERNAWGTPRVLRVPLR